MLRDASTHERAIILAACERKQVFYEDYEAGR